MTDATQHDIMDVEVGPESPATGVDAETLEAGLDSEDDTVRLHAANVASFVPREEVETLEAVLPSLINVLEDDLGTVVYQSTIALSLLAEHEPELLEPHVSQLVRQLEHDQSLVRTITAHALGHVALDHPEYFTEEVDHLVAVTATVPEPAIDEAHLDAEDLDRGARRTNMAINVEERDRLGKTRTITANLLVELAEYDPTLLEAHVPVLIEVLAEDDDVPVLTATADVVGTLARHDASLVTEAVDPLCDLLDHADDALVATVVQTLGFVGHPDAIEPLEALAAGEDDHEHPEDLRALADETAAFIADTA